MAVILNRDMAATHQAITQWLQRMLPDATAIEAPQLTAAEGGSSSETLFFSPRITCGGVTRQESWVLRIQASGYQVYQDPSVERQYRIMDAVRLSSTVPVPRVLWFEGDVSILGAPFFLMERVAGEVPDERYHSRGVLFDASPAQRQAMWLSGIQAMAAIHQIDPSKADFLARPELGTTGLDQEIAAWDAYRSWAQVPAHPVLERAKAWLSAHEPSLRSTGVAWGDARLGNMVFAGGACCGVLDWETASLGGAETDLGWWIYYDWWITEGTGVPRLEGIGGRDDTIRAWEQFSARKAEAMEWHEMFATYRFAIISERAIALMAAAGGSIEVGGGDANPAIARLRQLLD